VSANEYLRISNRGACPRLMLEIFGATDKRDRISDHNIIGVNGTGTKCAPVAAHRLNIGVAVTSTDEDGLYYVRYLARVQTLSGMRFNRLIMTYQDGTEVPMPCFTTAARNWDTPIGSDTMRSFRVVREYLTNGRDEDPRMSVQRVGKSDVKLAAPGTTTVYLSWHPEFEEILQRHPERYFKWFSAARPVFAVPGLGAIWPKSDPANTRLFCQGTLAACIPQETTGSLYDWSTDDKNRLSEDRELRELTSTYADFHLLLRQLTDVDLATRILAGALSCEDGVEYQALAAPVAWPPDGAFPAKDVWLQAWHKVCKSKEAVISSGNREHDESARYAYGKTVVTVSTEALRRFLRRCGVQSSRDFVPQLDPAASYKEIKPNAEEQARIDYVLKEVGLEYPGAKTLEYYMYEPKTVPARQQLGLTFFDEHGQPARVGFQRTVVRGPLETFIDVVLHELVHSLVPTAKHESEFIHYEGVDRARLFMAKRGIPHGHALDPPPPAPATSPETEAALKLIKKMGDKPT